MANSKFSVKNNSVRSEVSAQQSQPLPTMLSSIRVDYGPQDSLGRFFLMADYALQSMGITLGFGSFEEVVETNVTNRDTWSPLTPTFIPSSGLVQPECSYALIGRNSQGH